MKMKPKLLNQVGGYRAPSALPSSPPPLCWREPLCSLWILEIGGKQWNHHGKDSSMETRTGFSSQIRYLEESKVT